VFFKEVEKVRDESVNMPAEQDMVHKAEVERANISLGCVTSKFPDSVKLENGELVGLDNKDKESASGSVDDENVRTRREANSPEEEEL